MKQPDGIWPPPPKPSLRGISHLIAALVSIVAGIWLVGQAPPGAPRFASGVFMASMVLCFGTSAIYHRVDWGMRGLALMRRVDHGMIFIFIAGIYTPLCVMALSPESGRILLIAAWVGALAGIARVLLWPYAPRGLAVFSYMLIACMAIPFLGELLGRVGWAGGLLIGGANLTVGLGALAYVVQRPEPWPGVFGHHEVFHLTVVVCAICYFVLVMWLAQGRL